MITTLLFVASMVCMINYVVTCTAYILGNSLKLPLPIGHLFGVSYLNTYVFTFGLTYQVYFWFGYWDII